MRSPLKKILIAIIGIIFLGFLLYQISLRSQNEQLNYKKYGIAFNKKRTEIGLKKVSENWKYEYHNDAEPINGNSVDKIIKTFIFNDIKTGMTYEIDSLNKDKYLSGKITWINSNILFWRNGISAEMDFYERSIDSLTSENLFLTYYFNDDNGNKDYFEANHSIYKIDTFYCGTPAIMEREEQRISGKPYFGNITKKQADSILKKWKINNYAQ
ncbi:hypothetical protein [Mariniflexile sp. HMF6888]|uniref:hypothetical protein n=1 Tax=Mariniflexile sp. HMF6888 TaxID=3373086 RepID=UPI0037B9DF1C